MSEPAAQQTTMLEFFQRVWPQAGHFALFSPKDHFWVDGAEAAVKQAEILAGARDVYFSVSAFSKAGTKGGGRAARHASACKILFTDLDVGSKKSSDYATQEEALAAGLKWVKDHNFHPPTFIINSGNGIYLIWVLTQAVGIDRWLGVAEKFKRAMQATGFKFDPVVPADAARVIRVPGTTNFKDPANPKPCYVLHDSGQAVSIEDFERALPLTGPRDVAAPLAPPKPGKPKVENEYTAGLYDDYPPANVELIVQKCAQMAQAVRDRGKVEEPLWRARLSVLWRCEGGDTLIHEFSKGDPRYNPQQTKAKAEGTGGPATCAHFNDIAPDHCKGCPFSGKISSPILLGTDLPEPKTLPEDPPEEVRLNAFGRWKVTEVGVRAVVKDEESGMEDLLPVSLCPIWVTEVRERARDPDENDTSTLMLRWHSADGRSRHAVAMQSELHDTKSCTTWLANQNLIAQIVNVKLFMAYIKDATYEMTKLNRVTTYYDRLGWYGKGTFIMAGHKVTADAITPVRIQSSTPIGILAAAEGGSARAWGEAVAELHDYPPAYWHLFTILAGFASPLMSVAGWQCAILSLAGVTGTGKSTAMAGALSIYGSPFVQTMTSTATANAINLQTAAMQHLPTGVDEISRWKSFRMADFIYDMSNGIGKSALTQQRAMRRAPRWSLLPIVTTNSPIYDMPTYDVDEPIRRRVMELQFSKMETLPTEMAEKLHAALEMNHGHPGFAYMQHIIRNYDRVRKLLADTDEALKTNGGMDGADRFQRWLLAATFVGATMAVEVGIFPETFDFRPALAQVTRYVATVSQQHIPEEVRIKDAISDFLTENRDHIIYWASAGADYQPGVPTAFVETEVRDPVARYDFTTDDIYIHAATLREYLREKGCSLANVREWQRAVGIEQKAYRIARRIPPSICFKFPAARMGLIMDEVVEEDEV